MATKKYTGTPEQYLAVKGNLEENTDALMCSLLRASAVCSMLSERLDGVAGHTDINACWALEGLIQQAITITLGEQA